MLDCKKERRWRMGNLAYASNQRKLSGMSEIDVMTKLIMCLKGGNRQGFDDAREEIIARGGQVSFSFDEVSAAM
jgi:hypothetical protein